MSVDLTMLHSQTETQKEKHLVGHFRKKIRGLKQQNVITEAALWRLRWRQANFMVTLFETLERLHPGKNYYYTASAIGPAEVKCMAEFSGIPVEYKHTAAEWIPIWECVSEKLLKKVRECNQRKTIWGV